ncbi:unnamed protein product [Oikopleura dioica]|uniref:Ion transport domain-containing protein n=1 Tax=Oikopleura dioica TaxID=34765 RepID=E4YEP4_OIKDI|nr:unnamed protein product [Oikopleura dioica]
MTDITAVADQVRDAQTGYTIYGHNYARLSGKIRIFNLLKSKKWNTFLQLVTLVHCILRVWENDFSAPRKVGDKIDEDETPLWPVIVSAFILAIYICHSVVIILFYGKNLVRWKEFENSGPMRTEFIYLVLSCLFLIDFILLTIQYCFDQRMPQIFACFRSLLILTVRRKSRHVFKVITLVSFKMWKFWAALFGFILFFSAFSVHTFAKIYSCIISCDLETFREENSNLLNLEEYRCFDDSATDAQVIAV